MTTSVPDPGNESASPKARPVYSESELYDSPEILAKWPGLKPLLLTWQKVVWDADDSQVRGCWHYDQEAIRLQKRHRWAVISAAVTGTAAVVLAILQLGLAKQKLGWVTDAVLVSMEVVCVVAAAVTIILGVFLSLDHRWREFRFKAEQFRMLKFRFLHDAARWLSVDEEHSIEHLNSHIAKIHAADRQSILGWIHWKQEFLPELVRPRKYPDQHLAGEIETYFRERRLIPQQQYFQRRGHQLHGTERIVRWIGPTFFFASVVFALVHAAIHIKHKWEEMAANSQKAAAKQVEKATEKEKPKPAKDAAQADLKHEDHAEGAAAPHSEPSWMLILALLAAILPVAAAGVRTWRGAFEFGRNSLRFESMGHHLDHLLKELSAAETPEGKLGILRRGEYAMESEHRSWMRLMMESEWFG
ncbi:MAG: DUF4231 domain-containing protein [Pirellulaceae bacterium]